MPWILRDTPEPLWQKLQVRAAKEGWPLKALILQLVQDYVNGKVRPSGSPPMPPKVVVFPIVCASCHKRFEIECEHTPGFGYMSPHLIECPHCGKPNHPLLPADPIDVRKVPD
jgi:hypothetical protein